MKTINSFKIKRHFSYDMKLAMRPNPFTFLLTLVHMSEICSSSRSSERAQGSASLSLDLIEEPSKSDSV